ncbi:MAG: hypothetical protein KJS92_05785 [Bacteroidetes bacterium]|nr:hypothetical protein [Bacteroidota bacterium]
MKINWKTLPGRLGLVMVSFFLFPSESLNAQSFNGLNISNFQGVHGMYINPSSIVDSRYKTHVNITAMGTSFYNDYLSLDLPFTLMQLIRGKVPASAKNPSGQIQWDNSWLVEQINGKPKNASYNLEWRGPAAMISLSKRLAVGAGMRTRLGINLNNVDENLARTLRSGIDTAYNRALSKDNSFNLNMNSFQEVSGTMALVLVNKKSRYLKVGGTVKALFGIGSLYLNNKGLEVDSRNLDSLTINRMDMEIGYSNSAFIQNLSKGVLSASMPRPDMNGFGIGYDLGATMEWRPEATEALQGKNRYLLRLGVALLDMGGINYKRNVTSYSVSRNTPLLFNEDSAFNAAFQQGVDQGLNWMKDYAQRNLNYKEQQNSFRVNMPSTLSVQLDYNLFKSFYLGMLWNQSFVSRSSINFRRPSGIVFMPRFESRLFELSMPVSFNNDYTDAGLGAFLRLGPVYFGTDNLFRSIKTNAGFNGFNFYFGMSTGIGKSKKKQKDRKD